MAWAAPPTVALSPLPATLTPPRTITAVSHLCVECGGVVEVEAEGAQLVVGGEPVGHTNGAEQFAGLRGGGQERIVR